jgi:hypothetical protein
MLIIILYTSENLFKCKVCLVVSLFRFELQRSFKPILN